MPATAKKPRSLRIDRRPAGWVGEGEALSRHVVEASAVADGDVHVHAEIELWEDDATFRVALGAAEFTETFTGRISAVGGFVPSAGFVVTDLVVIEALATALLRAVQKAREIGLHETVRTRTEGYAR